MCALLSSAFLLLISSPTIFACIATAPTTPTTTTVATTTVAETTTAMTTSCTSCVATDIDFQAADGAAGSIDSSFREETVDPVTGCSRLTAICDANTGFNAFMEFNNGEGGPSENQNGGEIVEAALNCRDGIWYYRNERPITAVSCQEAING